MSWVHKKRKSSKSSEPPDDGIELTSLLGEVEDLRADAAALHRQFRHAGVHHMKVAGDRQRLGVALYQGDYARSTTDLRLQNPELVVMLYAQTSNSSMVTEFSEASRAHLIDGMLLDICRAKNMNLVPVLTAAQSILAEFNHVAREYHDTLAMYHRGAALSEKWVRDFLFEARNWRPPPRDICIDGVVVTVFDNLTMSIDYKSYASEGEVGHKLHMTNWLSTRVPKFLSPTINMRDECAYATEN